MTTADDWRQYNIEFPGRTTARHVAAHDLRPMLTAAEQAGVLHRWWFIRKQTWRLRCLPGDPTSSTAVADCLDNLTGVGRINTWTVGIYEPETTAFGGEAAMEVAHALFHRDSHYLLTRAAQQNASALGQRETTVLLCSAMLRAAGLDWYEQGDVWEKVAELRPNEPPPLSPEHADRLAEAIHLLMTANAHNLGDPANNGPLASYDGWIAAFEQTGQALADLARRGQLKRGLRAILAHHIIFHANRAELSVQDQSTLAVLVSNHVFNSAEATLPSAATARSITRLTR
jgi:protein-L-isoaspartate(D-aspartate) O-methyltransferase